MDLPMQIQGHRDGTQYNNNGDVSTMVRSGGQICYAQFNFTLNGFLDIDELLCVFWF